MSNLNHENISPTDQLQSQSPWQVSEGNCRTPVHQGESIHSSGLSSSRGHGGMALGSWVVGHSFLMFPTFYKCFISII